jgi:hypothetical protein
LNPEIRKKTVVYGFKGSIRHALRSGWKKFVQDNNLKIGDICLFELLSNQRIRTMEVYITPVNGGNLSISRTADVAEFPHAGNGLSGGTASCWLVNR